MHHQCTADLASNEAWRRFIGLCYIDSRSALARRVQQVRLASSLAMLRNFADSIELETCKLQVAR
jgi:hypothetical protein